MPRLIEVPLHETTSQLRSILRQVDYLVIDALVKIKDPGFAASQDTAIRERQAIQLKRELQGHLSFTFAAFPPVADDLRYLVAVMVIATDLEHMLACAGRIRDGAPGIGRPPASLLQLALVAQRQVSECFSAVHHFDHARNGSPQVIPADRLEAIVGTRAEAAALFQRVVSAPEAERAGLRACQLELQGAVADGLERMVDLAAGIAEQLLFYRTGRR